MISSEEAKTLRRKEYTSRKERRYAEKEKIVRIIRVG